MISHFCVKVYEKPSNHINKNIYLSTKPEGLLGWTEELYNKQKIFADINYDLNMAYFNSLDFSEFNCYLLQQCNKFKFKECNDLNDLEYMYGVYILVLDEFKQVYIGTSENIKKRIRSHWNNKKSLERLLWGDVLSSILSIDSFGPLDTTRIFYKKTYATYSTEEKIVRNFDPKYLLNRTAGGIGVYDLHLENSTDFEVSVFANQKTRNLIDFIDIEKFKNVMPTEDFNYYLETYPQLKDKLK